MSQSCSFGPPERTAVIVTMGTLDFAGAVDASDAAADDNGSGDNEYNNGEGNDDSSAGKA